MTAIKVIPAKLKVTENFLKLSVIVHYYCTISGNEIKKDRSPCP